MIWLDYRAEDSSLFVIRLPVFPHSPGILSHTLMRVPLISVYTLSSVAVLHKRRAPLIPRCFPPQR